MRINHRKIPKVAHEPGISGNWGQVNAAARSGNVEHNKKMMGGENKCAAQIGENHNYRFWVARTSFPTKS